MQRLQSGSIYRINNLPVQSYIARPGVILLSGPNDLTLMEWATCTVRGACILLPKISSRALVLPRSNANRIRRIWLTMNLAVDTHRNQCGAVRIAYGRTQRATTATRPGQTWPDRSSHSVTSIRRQLFFACTRVEHSSNVELHLSQCTPGILALLSFWLKVCGMLSNRPMHPGLQSAGLVSGIFQNRPEDTHSRLQRTRCPILRLSSNYHFFFRVLQIKCLRPGWMSPSGSFSSSFWQQSRGYSGFLSNRSTFGN